MWGAFAKATGAPRIDPLVILWRSIEQMLRDSYGNQMLMREERGILLLPRAKFDGLWSWGAIAAEPQWIHICTHTNTHTKIHTHTHTQPIVVADVVVVVAATTTDAIVANAALIANYVAAAAAGIAAGVAASIASCACVALFNVAGAYAIAKLS